MKKSQKVDKERERKNSHCARAEKVLTPPDEKKKTKALLTNSPTTLNGCPLSMMLRPFLISAVVAVPARTCLCVCVCAMREEEEERLA